MTHFIFITLTEMDLHTSVVGCEKVHGRGCKDSPEFEVGHEFLHGHVVQKHKVRFSELQALVLCHDATCPLGAARGETTLTSFQRRQQVEHWRASEILSGQLVRARCAFPSSNCNFTRVNNT